MLQPLIFLGGVFYSASLLPEPFQTITHFNPVYYMIGLVPLRLPRLLRGERRAVALAPHLATFALFTLNYRLFARGYRLRA